MRGAKVIMLPHRGCKRAKIASRFYPQHGLLLIVMITIIIIVVVVVVVVIIIKNILGDNWMHD